MDMDRAGVHTSIRFITLIFTLGECQTADCSVFNNTIKALEPYRSTMLLSRIHHGACACCKDLSTIFRLDIGEYQMDLEEWPLIEHCCKILAFIIALKRIILVLPYTS